MKKTIIVRCKIYSNEKEKIQEINLDRFNPEIHRKLFWRNFLITAKKWLKSNSKKIINHGWTIGIGCVLLAYVLSR